MKRNLAVFSAVLFLRFLFMGLGLVSCLLSLLSHLIGGTPLFALVNQSGVPLNAFLRRRSSQSFQGLASVLARRPPAPLPSVAAATGETVSARGLPVFESVTTLNTTLVPTGGS